MAKMKRPKLFRRVFWAGAILFGLANLAMAVFASWKVDRGETEEFEIRGAALAEGIAQSSVEVILDGDASTIQANVDKYLRFRGVSYILVQDPQGDVIAHTFVPGVPEELRTISGDNSKTTIRRLTISNGQDAIDVAAPILSGQLGFVHVGMDKKLIREVVWSHIAQQAGVMGGIFLVAIAAAYFLAGKVSRPLAVLTGCARRLASEETSSGSGIQAAAELTPIAARSDEVGALAQAVQHMVQEISTRERGLKDAEATMRNREAHFRSLIENVSDIIMKLDASGKVRYASPSLERHLGFKSTSWTDREFLDLVQPEDRFRLQDHFQEVLRKQGQTPSVEFRLPHSDRTLRLMEAIPPRRPTAPRVNSSLI